MWVGGDTEAIDTDQDLKVTKTKVKYAYINMLISRMEIEEY